MESWTIIGAVSSIVGAIAAIIAAYFAFISSPKMVKDINLEVQTVKNLNDNEWEIEFNIRNEDRKTILQDAMVCIKTEGLNQFKAQPITGAIGALLYIPTIHFEGNSIIISIEKLKPRTRQVYVIRFKAEPRIYCFEWSGYSPNFKEKKGYVTLDLKTKYEEMGLERS
ncbi:hypothetical protein [Desulfosporosinus sp. FKB]|uniref:hypothetical protein n=1 Tax=Desulfosporosinus sp. FKB TaxID=1969835 RepID=UPI000B49AB55|nr:hypothetical protein [Desulfosporosinus sp. FKB]